MSDSSDDEPLALKKAKLEKKVAPRPVTGEKPVASAKLPKGGSSVSASKSVKVKSEPASRSKKSAPVENSTKSSKDSKEAKPVIKREKKVYELPGQTRDPPDELDPLRKFYSSLKQQRPESQMARKWLCMYGLLSAEEAEVFLKEIGKTLKSPVKKERVSSASAKPPKKRSSTTTSTVKRKAPLVKHEEGVSDEVKAAPKRPKVKKESGQKTKVPEGMKGKYTVFEDGHLDSDSDDDKPLGLRL